MRRRGRRKEVERSRVQECCRREGAQRSRVLDVQGTSLCVRRGADRDPSPGVEDCAGAIVRLCRGPERARGGVERLDLCFAAAPEFSGGHSRVILGASRTKSWLQRESRALRLTGLLARVVPPPSDRSTSGSTPCGAINSELSFIEFPHDLCVVFPKMNLRLGACAWEECSPAGFQP